MRQRGRLTRRNDDRGFGLITPLVFFGLLAVLGVFARIAWTILLVDLVLSAATLLAYRSDKRAAGRGRWRTKESTLHLMSLFGGWPGALAAQRLYRHKTRKQPFQAIYWLTVAANLAALAWLLAAGSSGSILS